MTIADARGDTPLHVAAEEHDNSTQLIEILCAAGADVRAKNLSGATPLHTAAKYSIEAIHALILYGRMTVDDINKADNDGFTPLHYAAMSETGYNCQYLFLFKHRVGMHTYCCFSTTSYAYKHIRVALNVLWRFQHSYKRFCRFRNSQSTFNASYRTTWRGIHKTRK